MPKLEFEVLRIGDGWVITENGHPGTISYATRESAFEAMVGAAFNALKEGAELSIVIHGEDHPNLG